MELQLNSSDWIFINELILAEMEAVTEMGPFDKERLNNLQDLQNKVHMIINYLAFAHQRKR